LGGIPSQRHEQPRSSSLTLRISAGSRARRGRWRSQRRTRWIRSVYRKFFKHIAGGRDVGDVHRRFNTKAGGKPGCERPAPHDQIVADLAKIKTKVYPLNFDDDGLKPARLLILERMLKYIPRAKYAVQAGSKGPVQQVGELVRKYEGSRLRSPGQQAGPRWTSRMRSNRPWDPVSACVARESCPIAGIERENRRTEFPRNRREARSKMTAPPPISGFLTRILRRTKSSKAP
jgi:hypothetical protein